MYSFSSSIASLKSRIRLQSGASPKPSSIPTPSAPILHPNSISLPDSPTISLDEARQSREIVYRSLSLLFPPEQPGIILSVDFRYATLPTLVSLQEAQQSDHIRLRGTDI
ncbi:hypothetical protein PNOK_0460000 [Pyrrhoderma noxium]|uniref:Uncharacterized protein n=1 Tax=Pyrrhoderma noxium TaxID=2282107 RepID=A0A286UJ66_9AGAM|nr:hypothetical protein PNOK_0460000 [Pyrrhoderma noxium]